MHLFLPCPLNHVCNPSQSESPPLPAAHVQRRDAEQFSPTERQDTNRLYRSGYRTIRYIKATLELPCQLGRDGCPRGPPWWTPGCGHDLAGRRSAAYSGPPNVPTKIDSQNMDCIETLYLLFLMSYLTTESPTLFSQLSLAPHDTKICRIFRWPNQEARRRAFIPNWNRNTCVYRATYWLNKRPDIVGFFIGFSWQKAGENNEEKSEDMTSKSHTQVLLVFVICAPPSQPQRLIQRI